MVKGYILMSPLQKLFLYIPETEEIGPATVYTMENNAMNISYTEYLDYELAVRDGKSCVAQRIKEIDVPNELVDIIEVKKDYINKEPNAIKVFNKITDFDKVLKNP